MWKVFFGKDFRLTLLKIDIKLTPTFPLIIVFFEIVIIVIFIVRKDRRGRAMNGFGAIFGAIADRD